MILGSVFIKVEVPVVETQTRESRFRSSSSGCRVVVYTTPCNSFRLSRAKKALPLDPSGWYVRDRNHQSRPARGGNTRVSAPRAPKLLQPLFVCLCVLLCTWCSETEEQFVWVQTVRGFRENHLCLKEDGSSGIELFPLMCWV
jgi:hypothetical protein